MQLEHIHPLKFLGAGAFANVFMVRAGVRARVRARVRASARARARARVRARVGLGLGLGLGLRLGLGLGPGRDRDLQRTAQPGEEALGAARPVEHLVGAEGVGGDDGGPGLHRELDETLG